MRLSFNERLREHGRPIGYDVFHADVSWLAKLQCIASNNVFKVRDVLRMPLVHQPGEAWEYGTSWKSHRIDSLLT